MSARHSRAFVGEPVRPFVRRALARARGGLGTWIIAALLFLLGPRVAQADGGIVLLHEARGPFSVTVFVAPEATRGGPADLSVLVQWRTNGEVVLDADVSLALNSPVGLAMNPSDPFCGELSANGTRLSQTLRATRAQAANKLLYAAPLNLSAAGDWPLHLIVSRGAESADFDCLLPAVNESAKLAGLWPYLAFPPIAITAFALNQKLRKHSLEQKT